ncbi:hypothetical protein K440DRAFT_636162 [Wilcoxina mikolae CBS 423.85]|nr:hypothetical protein K440DRAFT_636162 [Wilcoxina mikolae CBS 423.85]
MLLARPNKIADKIRQIRRSSEKTPNGVALAREGFFDCIIIVVSVRHEPQSSFRLAYVYCTNCLWLVVQCRWPSPECQLHTAAQGFPTLFETNFYPTHHGNCYLGSPAFASLWDARPHIYSCCAQVGILLTLLRPTFFAASGVYGRLSPTTVYTWGENNSPGKLQISRLRASAS